MVYFCTAEVLDSVEILGCVGVVATRLCHRARNDCTFMYFLQVASRYQLSWDGWELAER